MLRMWRRPFLFQNWLEAIVWAFFAAVAAGASAGLALRGPHWLLGIVPLATFQFIAWRKFGGRVHDMRSVAYRTVHGVAVIFRGMAPLPQLVVEQMHEQAIEAHGHPEALDGYGLIVQWAPLYADGVRVMGVTDGGYMQVDASACGGVFTNGTIRHEAARAILGAQGLTVAAQDEIMRAHGTY